MKLLSIYLINEINTERDSAMSIVFLGIENFQQIVYNIVISVVMIKHESISLWRVSLEF